jgi:hypothetical protein
MNEITEKIMKNLKSYSIMFLVATALFLGASAAQADSLTITLTQDFQIATTGSTVTFEGTVTDNKNHTVGLNGALVSLEPDFSYDPSQGTSLDASSVDFVDYFYNNFPLALTAGEVSSGGATSPASDALFSVTVPLGTATGVYAGQFEIQSGRNGATNYTAATVDYFVDVVPTPEPSSLLFLGSGLVGLMGMMRRRLKA